MYVLLNSLHTTTETHNSRQLLLRTPTPTLPTPPPTTLRHPRPHLTLPNRPNIRHHLNLRARYNRYFPRRLLRYFNGQPRRIFPFQRIGKSNVRRKYVVFYRWCAVVCVLHGFCGFCYVSFLIVLLIRYERPAGLLLSLFVYIVYFIALRFEGCVFYLSFHSVSSFIHLDRSQR